MDIEKFLELKNEYDTLQETYVAKLAEADNPKLSIKEMLAKERESRPFKKAADAANYKFRQYIASLNPEDLESMDIDDFKKYIYIIIFYCADFQRNIFMRILEKRLPPKND